jgi:hypothetical protein
LKTKKKYLLRKIFSSRCSIGVVVVNLEFVVLAPEKNNEDTASGFRLVPGQEETDEEVQHRVVHGVLDSGYNLGFIFFAGCPEAIKNGVEA